MKVNHLVSVSLITYNQIKFIEKTINGIIKQKTDFYFDIIIGDDCSTDGTVELLKQYASQNSNIELVLHKERNTGIPGKVNFLSTIERCKGKYIALCDGDDYWTDPYKLQKQVNILESNPNYSICFHKVLNNYIENPELNNNSESHKTVTTLRELASFNYKYNFNYSDKNLVPLYNYITAVSCVFRNRFESLPEWFLELYTGDYALHLLNARYGDIYFIDEVMATYNIHNNSVWRLQKEEYKHIQYLTFLLSIVDKFDKDVRKIVEENIFLFIIYVSNLDKNIFKLLIKEIENKENILDGLLLSKMEHKISNSEKVDMIFSEIIKSIEVSKMNHENDLFRNSLEYKLGKKILKPYRFFKKIILS